ncbi:MULTISPECIES: AcrVA2 family anti-CRISPR protein [Ralstonia solanacearum species complex]|uniref:AcrVA2 family anti-CRISPR protein n=1 Tax=Ralstonia solanacearum species complex TaxID=3116862 RepID=UPI0018D0D769|nr:MULTISPECIES: hypothetical protein [Ralstonia solanacearum species complex]MDN3368279.1 hypothetical protein [Ralstonia pseudosolanacearum]
MDAPRPKMHLIAAGKMYPNAWRQVDEMRAGRGRNYPDWAEWCYLPLAAAAAIVANDAGIDVLQLPRLYPALIPDVARLGGLAIWRVTQGVYRFDPALYPALIDTPLDGDIPCDVLYRLPEWCVYVETPGLTAFGRPLLGAFAHLEHDHASGRPELRLLLDQEEALTPLPLHLGEWPLVEALQRATREARHQSMKHAISRSAFAVLDGREHELKGLAAELAPLLALLLYLCAAPEEIGRPEHRPANPQPKRTKQGLRWFAPDKVTQWDVGVRIGAALRRGYHAAEIAHAQGEASGARTRPHIRRAHWHGFRSGPKKREDGSEIQTADRSFDLRWLPPIPVNVDDSDGLPAVVHPVTGER